MEEPINKKERFFKVPTTEHEISEGNVVTFDANLKAPIDVAVNIAPKTEGSTHVTIYNANCIFQFPNRITPHQKGEGDPSPRNVRFISPGLSIVRSDGSILDVYDGTLTIHDDGSWTVTKSTDNYHPTGNESNYSKTGNQILFQVPSVYKITGYSYYACSNFANTVAQNSYVYIRTDMSITELQDYFSKRSVDLILPLVQTESYEISIDEVKQTMARMSSYGISSFISVDVGHTDGPVYGGTLVLYRDGTADLTVTHDLIGGELQELVTPVERHLESVGTLWSYFGINNVWADSGNILSITYRSQTPVNGMMWQRDRELQLRRRAIMAAAFQSLTYFYILKGG